MSAIPSLIEPLAEAVSDRVLEKVKQMFYSQAISRTNSEEMWRRGWELNPRIFALQANA